MSSGDKHAYQIPLKVFFRACFEGWEKVKVKENKHDSNKNTVFWKPIFCNRFQSLMIKRKILFQACLVSCWSHLCGSRLFKAHRAPGWAGGSRHDALYWPAWGRGGARDRPSPSWLAEARCQSTFRSLPSPAPSLHWLDPTAQVRILTKTSPRSLRNQGSTATRPHGPSGVTAKTNGVLGTGQRCFVLPEWKRRQRGPRCEGNERGVTRPPGRGGPKRTSSAPSAGKPSAHGS